MFCHILFQYVDLLYIKASAISVNYNESDSNHENKAAGSHTMCFVGKHTQLVLIILDFDLLSPDGEYGSNAIINVNSITMFFRPYMESPAKLYLAVRRFSTVFISCILPPPHLPQ